MPNLVDALGAGLGHSIERGIFTGPVATALAGVWRGTAGRNVVRRLHYPSSVRAVSVGGSTLGGSGKTPVAIACAIELARTGVPVAFVGHAYGARPGRARYVRSSDSLAEVGDEALVASRELASWGVRVVVAPSRAAAVILAAEHARIIVLDGILQTAPIAASLALLALQGSEPWGKVAAFPPLGDLRAPPHVLLSACDAVVAISPGAAPTAADGGRAGERRRFGERGALPTRPPRPHWAAEEISRGAWLDAKTLLPWSELRCLRIGWISALARPERLRRLLLSRGVDPCVHVCGPDHGPLPRAAHLPKVDLWLATAKCALHAKSASLPAPIATVDYSVELHPALQQRLTDVALS